MTGGDAAVWARVYEAGLDGWTRIPAPERFSATVARALPPGSRVLDVGTGRGVDAVIYGDAGHAFTGIDLVSFAEWGVLARRPMVSFRQCALVDFWPQKPFDAVVDSGCLHHQAPSSLAGHLASERRVLRTGGSLFLATLRRDGGDERFAISAVEPDVDGSWTVAFSEGELHEYLYRAGFDALTLRAGGRPRRNGLCDLFVRAVAV